MLSETPLLFDEDENCCILQVTQEEGLHYSEKYSAVSTSVVEYDGAAMLLLVKWRTTASFIKNNYCTICSNTSNYEYRMIVGTQRETAPPSLFAAAAATAAARRNNAHICSRRS